jgi:Family of unknown function (DUF6476)
MRGLKVLVVVMGVMLVVGFAVLAAAVIGKISRGGGSATSHTRTFANAAIDIPRGARIEAMTIGADRLALALALPQGDRQLVVIDLGTGTRVGTIELHPSP